MVAQAAAVVRHELVGLGGVVERNWYLVKRYVWWEVAFFLWTCANTLTIVFISKGVGASAAEQNQLAATLLIGGVIWAYLGIIFEILTETVAWERWEGTIEYTFMAPLSRPVHLIGMGLFAIAYGLVRATLIFGVVAAMFGLHMPDANFGTAILLLGIASVSFIGIGMMTAVLPLISPATYALDGIRDAIIDGAGVTDMWPNIWPLILIGMVSIPLGLEVFRRGERYAKKHGKLKRSG